MNSSLETIFVCIKQFNARLGDELSLQIGDRIEILADDSEYNDGWFMGRNTESNAVGLFPKSFTKPEAPLDPKKPSLLRSRSRRVLTGGSTTSNSSASKVPSGPAPTKPLNDKQSTINDIDKALKELQTSSLDPSLNQKSKTHMGHSHSTSVSSLTQDLNPLKASTWTPKQVSSYFAIVLGFDMSIAGKFARHKITGEILFQLDLPHLKELEIDSFGTRFEIFKEIEKLKQISSRMNSSSQASPSKESHANRVTSAPFNNSDDSQIQDDFDYSQSSSKFDRKVSKRISTQLLPSVDLRSASFNALADTTAGKPPSISNSSVKYHQRTRSQSLDNINFNDILDSPNHTTFLSPRKAPDPPSQSPMSSNFKFGGSPVAPHQSMNSSPNPYSLRDKSNSHGLSRPASSIYDNPANGHHRRTSSGLGGHRRHSSMFSFLSGNLEDPIIDTEKFQLQKRASKFFQDGDLTIIGDDLDIEDGSISPKKSSSALTEKPAESRENPQGKLKGLRSVSTQNFRNLTVSKKSKTSAFTEGIREINPDDAIKTSNFSGWMAKKSGNSLGWRSRYFTLHGTRLSYYTSLRDKREKGLIDITAHKVLPISTEGEGNTSNDKYIALYASSTGFGRYCFKLIPPAPGFKKGLTFTQPKTHYFAVETQDEMRGWLKALMTATIDIDDSVPVVSSCNTPTVSLAKAQELLTKAREETKLKDDELRARGFVRIGETEGDIQASISHNDSASSGEPSPVIGSIDEATLSSNNTGLGGKAKQPKLTLDTQVKNHRGNTTSQPSLTAGGFASPYLLASGLLSPKPNGSISPKAPQFPSDVSTPQASTSGRSDYFGSSDGIESTKDTASRDTSKDHMLTASPTSSSSKPVDGGKKKPTNEKMMAYTSDGSFVIKSKKK
ncbi:hypothetical protein JCM33374_g3051 [Metschnikowia sp. JCM 33374]|nr:hypothetical protein JCM33374_g3051 [Metschnikowia sp. JCM 33374]